MTGRKTTGITVIGSLIASTSGRPLSALAWKTTVDLTDKRYVEVRVEDLAANWPEQRRTLFERLDVDDFATRSTFQSHLLENRNDQFDPGTREYVERTLDGVIPAMGYA